MHTLNLGILAHVDAGKTSLTERLLFEAGAIDHVGRVDHGTTVTDSMPIERRRGITVRTNVASFVVADMQVNVVDTPGHSDFIAEVERGLTVLDAAVLVVSAVEGVQPQTVVLWRALRRLGVPTLVFVNKTDRRTADVAAAVATIRRRLTAPQGMGLVELATASDARSPIVLEELSRHDDRLLGQLVDGPPVGARAAVRTLRGQIRDGKVLAVLAGSALTGAGVPGLVATLPRLLPWARPGTTRLSGVVFKVDRDDHGRIGWVRVFGGELRTRERLSMGGRRPQRITALRRATPGGMEQATTAGVGDIVAVRGLDVRVGAWFGDPDPRRLTRQFPPPALESVVEVEDPAQRGRLFHALKELAEADPLINLRVDEDRNEVAVSLYGEVQKEVVGTLLDEQFGIKASFRETTTVQIERIVGVGADHAIIAEKTTPYLATLGLRVEAVPPSTGLVFDLEVELGSMPRSFFTASEEGVRTGLAQGRYGWQIPDARVVITHSGYWPRQSAMHAGFSKAISSVAADFRNLAPILIHSALHHAGTVVCEPIEAFRLEVPQWAVQAVAKAIAHLEGALVDTAVIGEEMVLSGSLPTRRMRGLVSALPELARGEAVLTSEVVRYQPVPGAPPRRRRVGPDPLNRDVWFKERPR
ncbi:MAG: GTP-binding protein [Nocardioidaceae bacterium]